MILILHLLSHNGRFCCPDAGQPSKSCRYSSSHFFVSMPRFGAPGKHTWHRAAMEPRIASYSNIVWRVQPGLWLFLVFEIRLLTRFERHFNLFLFWAIQLKHLCFCFKFFLGSIRNVRNAFWKLRAGMESDFLVCVCVCDQCVTSFRVRFMTTIFQVTQKNPYHPGILGFQIWWR